MGQGEIELVAVSGTVTIEIACIGGYTVSINIWDHYFHSVNYLAELPSVPSKLT